MAQRFDRSNMDMRLRDGSLRPYPKWQDMILAVLTDYDELTVKEIGDIIHETEPAVPRNDSSKVQLRLALRRGLDDGLWTVERSRYSLLPEPLDDFESEEETRRYQTQTRVGEPPLPLDTMPAEGDEDYSYSDEEADLEASRGPNIMPSRSRR